jgi:hypothetical protein
MIDFQGVEGWLDSSFIEWGDGVAIDALPERVMPDPPPTPTATPQTATPTSTSAPTLAPTNPATAVPSAALAEPPSTTPTFTPSATIRAMAVTSEAESSSVVPEVGGSVASIPPGGILAIGAAGVLLLGFYGWRYALGARNLRRYADGFAVEWCPVCRTGRLHLDEHVARVVGVPRVHRTVRCDECRSVLREMEPGVWRYAVDPVADEDFAADYNGELVDDATLIELASRSQEPEESEEPEEPETS